MVRSEQVKITLEEIDAKRLQQLSDNTGLAKSTLVKLMLGGTLRDLQNDAKSESASLIRAWCSKSTQVIVKDIYVY